MPTIVDRKGELVRVLDRLGIGLLDLITSIRDEIVVLDRERRVVAVLGDRPHQSPGRPEDLLGRTSREIFGPQAAAVHEAAQRRVLQGEYVVYEWVRKGRQPTRFSTTASPLRGSSSDIVGIVLITRQMTGPAHDDGRVDGSIAKAERLLELEHSIQQLAGAIENYHKTGRPARGFRTDSALHQLSPRERQVLDLLGQGCRPRSIAEKLHVSPETVRNHLKAMFRKTGTHSQEELTAMLHAWHRPRT